MEKKGLLLLQNEVFPWSARGTRTIKPPRTSTSGSHKASNEWRRVARGRFFFLVPFCGALASPVPYSNLFTETEWGGAHLNHSNDAPLSKRVQTKSFSALIWARFNRPTQRKQNDETILAAAPATRTHAHTPLSLM